jgi:hypothetical protein
MLLATTQWFRKKERDILSDFRRIDGRFMAPTTTGLSPFCFDGLKDVLGVDLRGKKAFRVLVYDSYIRGGRKVKLLSESSSGYEDIHVGVMGEGGPYHMHEFMCGFVRRRKQLRQLVESLEPEKLLKLWLVTEVDEGEAAPKTAAGEESA